jgi:hypothetical protein
MKKKDKELPMKRYLISSKHSTNLRRKADEQEW